MGRQNPARFAIPLIILLLLCSCMTEHTYRAVIVDSGNNVIDSYPIEPLPEKEWARILASDFLASSINPARYHEVLMQGKFFLRLYPESRYGSFVYHLGLWSAILASEYDPELANIYFSFKRAYVRQGYLREALDLIQRYGNLNDKDNPSYLSDLLERGFWDEGAFGTFCSLMRASISVDPGALSFSCIPQKADAVYLEETHRKWSEDSGFRRFYENL